MIAAVHLHGLWLIVGFVLWSAAFLALYGLHALGCAWDWGESTTASLSILRIALIAVWGLHLALLAILIPRLRRLQHEENQDTNAFLLAISFALGLAALVATFWIGLPVMILPTCT